MHKNDEHRDWIYDIDVTNDGKFLVLTTWTGSSHVRTSFRLYNCSERPLNQHNLFWIAEFDAENIGLNINWIRLVDEFKANYHLCVILPNLRCKSDTSFEV